MAVELKMPILAIGGGMQLLLDLGDMAMAADSVIRGASQRVSGHTSSD
jgi:gamma-glutamyl-gamma-aminobutyrate hydrolase PuuD